MCKFNIDASSKIHCFYYFDFIFSTLKNLKTSITAFEQMNDFEFFNLSVKSINYFSTKNLF